MKGISKYTYLLILFLVISYSSQSTHLVGGSLTYDYLGQTSNGDYRYELKLRMFRDAANPQAPPFDSVVYLGLYEDDPNLGRDQVIEMRINDRIGEAVDVPSGGSDCSFEPNVEIFTKTYEKIITVPPSSHGYHITHERCCRNNTLVNLVLFMGQTYYAFIPPTIRQNTSPDFNDIPTPYICAGDTTKISYKAQDADGDSLAYSLEVPYHGGSQNIPAPYPPFSLSLPIDDVTYANGYSFQNPFGINGVAKIDPVTGLATISAPNAGRYALAVEVKEYRNGNLISQTRRDIQIIVLDCPPNPTPSYFRPNSNNAPNFDPYKTDFEIIEGETFNLDIRYEDSDSMELTYQGSIFDEVDPPRAKLDSTRGIDTIQTFFSWPTACHHGRKDPYIFRITVNDKGCPPKQEITSFTLQVNEYEGARIDGSDSACTLDDYSRYTAAITKGGKDSVFWDVEGGSIVDGQYTKTVYINWQKKGTNTVKAFTKSKYGCNPDTSIFKVKVFEPPKDLGGTDRTMCSGDTIILGASKPVSYVNFLWLDSIYLNDSDIQNPSFTVQNSTSTPKKVNVRVQLKKYACKTYDTVTITVYPRPSISELNGDFTPCFGNSYKYEAISSSSTQYHWQVEGGIPTDTTTIDNHLNLKWTAEDTGDISVVGVNQYNCPSDTFSRPINIIHPVIDTIWGTRVVCPNSSRIRYWVDSQAGSDYEWFVSKGNIVSGQGNGLIRVNWGDSGRAAIKVVETTKEGCVSDTFTLPIRISYHLETSEIYGDTSVCEFSSHYYNVKFTNGSTYDWWVNRGQFTKEDPGSRINADWGPKGMGMIKVLETSYDSVNDKICLGDTVYQQVSINPVPDPSPISGPDTLCEEKSGKFHITGFDNSTFHWEFNKDVIKEVWNDGDSVEFKFLNKGDYEIVAYELTKDSCLSQPRYHKIHIKDKPEKQPVLGKDTVCAPGEKGVQYSYPGDSTSEYIWQVNGGAITNGNGKSEIKINWKQQGKGNIRVKEKNKEGCLSEEVVKPVIVDLLDISIEKVTTLKDRPEILRIDWNSKHNSYLNDNYYLFRKKAGEFVYSKAGEFPPHKWFYEDINVRTYNFPYNYRLETYNICYSKVSSDVHQSILLASKKPSEEALILNWTPYIGWGKNNIKQYRIYRRVNQTQGYTYEFVKAVPGNQTQANIASTHTGYRQCYRIKAIKETNNSVQSWSNEICRKFPPFIHVPNAFSPWDNNGVNDVFKVETGNLKSFKMSIYTRWGEKVFESINPDEGWDGMYKNKKSPVGTYLVKIVYEGHKLKQVYSGTLHLLR